MIARILLSSALPALAGACIVRLCWPQHLVRRAMTLQFTLVIAIGIGVSSIDYYLYRALLGSTGLPLSVIEFVGVIACSICFAHRRRRAHTIIRARQPWSAPQYWLAAALAASLIGDIVLFLSRVHQLPDGDWDAWAIWNLHARFLYRGGRGWTDLFLPILAWSHPDYPLLLPAAISRVWTFLGHESSRVPVGIACLFTFATILAPSSAICYLRGRTQGLLAALLLAATPQLVLTGAGQLPDIEISYFFAAALACIAIHHEEQQNHPGFLTLAGVAAGFAAWTKNEGCAVLVAVTGCAALMAILRTGFRKGLLSLVPYAKGCIPVLVFVLSFKLIYAPPNDLIAGQHAAIIGTKLLDWHRHYMITKAMIGMALSPIFGMWWVPLLALFAAMNTDRCRDNVRWTGVGVAGAVLTLGLMYYAVYLSTPHDLEWHLKSSLDRLCMHLWPSALLAYFLVFGTREFGCPEGAVAARPVVGITVIGSSEHVKLQADDI